MDKIKEAAKRVCSIQAEYDAENHRTTGAIFMQTHGVMQLYERDRILNEIDARRTKAIWSLDRMLSAQAHAIIEAKDYAPGGAARMS